MYCTLNLIDKYFLLTLSPSLFSSVPTIFSVNLNDSVINPSVPITQPLGVSFSLSCYFNNTTPRSTVQWTLNGGPVMGGTVNTSDDASWTSLNLSSFLSEGVYRCQVTNANGRSVGQDIQLYASLEGKGERRGRGRERERCLITCTCTCASFKC